MIWQVQDPTLNWSKPFNPQALSWICTQPNDQYTLLIRQSDLKKHNLHFFGLIWGSNMRSSSYGWRQPDFKKTKRTKMYDHSAIFCFLAKSIPLHSRSLGFFHQSCIWWGMRLTYPYCLKQKLPKLKCFRDTKKGAAAKMEQQNEIKEHENIVILTSRIVSIVDWKEGNMQGLNESNTNKVCLVYRKNKPN